MRTTLGRILNMQIRWSRHEVIGVMAKKLGYTTAFMNDIENGRMPVPQQFYSKLVEHGYVDDIASQLTLKQAIKDHALESLASAEVSLEQAKINTGFVPDAASKKDIDAWQDEVDMWHVLIKRLEREGAESYYGLGEQ